jgi:hypothetical protein
MVKYTSLSDSIDRSVFLDSSPSLSTDNLIVAFCASYVCLTSPQKYGTRGGSEAQRHEKDEDGESSSEDESGDGGVKVRGHGRGHGDGNGNGDGDGRVKVSGG